MSEIVIIKTTGQVGVVRSVLINSATGEEVVEVQPVGRAHGFNRFVPRADVETAGRKALAFGVSEVLFRAMREIEDSVGSELDADLGLSVKIAKVTEAIMEVRRD